MQQRHGGRRAVRGEHDLRARIERGLDRVEELLRGALLVLEELDVVEQQHVDGAVALLEGRDPVVLERGQELARERLRVRKADRQPAHAQRDVVADRLEQVCLADPGRTADEERVVDLARKLGGRQRGGVREAVRRADHERVERIARLEVEVSGVGAAGQRRRRRSARSRRDGRDARRRPRPAARRSAAGPTRAPSRTPSGRGRDPGSPRAKAVRSTLDTPRAGVRRAGCHRRGAISPRPDLPRVLATTSKGLRRVRRATAPPAGRAILAALRRASPGAESQQGAFTQYAPKRCAARRGQPGGVVGTRLAGRRRAPSETGRGRPYTERPRAVPAGSAPSVCLFR